MFFSNLKIAYRHLAKNPAFSVINIFGLTLGFACFILISLYIYDELHFDGIHGDSDNIYRIVQNEQKEDGELRKVAVVAGQVGPESIRQFPEISDFCRVAEFGRVTMGNDPETRGYERLISADSNFFKFFDFSLVEGNPEKALTEPDGVVISERLAIRYFSRTDVLGKVIWINGNDMFVAGVMRNFPTNSHLQIDLMYSQPALTKYYTWFRRFETSDWSTNSFATYIKLPTGASTPALEGKITDLVARNYPSDKTFRSKFALQNLMDIHLGSEGMEDYAYNPSGFNRFYVSMFTVVAFLILLIAGLNYMNLSTAAAFKRTAEIGTRKTMGAGRFLLASQFVGEAIILSVFSLLLALAIVQALLPSVGAFTEKSLALSQLSTEWAAAIVFALLASGVLASIYPAFVVSSVSPVVALKKEIRLANSSIPLRKLLVVAQFTVSIMMIASTLVIYQQLSYMRQKQLGFDVENLVAIDINSGKLRRQFEAVKNEFSRISEVQSVSVSSRVPGEWKSFPIASTQVAGTQVTQEMIFVGIDLDFLRTFDINLIEGRNFTADRSDSSKVILTRLAAEKLGLENPVGQQIIIPSANFGGNVEVLDRPMEVEVIGVVDDFYFESFKSEMRPLLFGFHSNPIQSIDYFTLRIKSTNWDQTIASLRKVNAGFDPNNPVEYNFLDSKFDEFYRNDSKRGTIFLSFSIAIILIACLGLFALVTYSIEGRKKEIGVRKVLGASTGSIVSLLSREFLSLVLIAFGIAIPAVLLTMREWLAEFAYHIKITPGIFITAGMTALLIAFVTISIKSMKAAIANPVDSLRNE